MGNKRAFTMATVLGITAVILTLWVTPAFAQSREMQVSVPFQFYAGGKLMPAGLYFVRPMDTGGSILRVFDNGGHTALLLTVPTGNKLGSSRWVFTRYGELSFLSELHWRGYDAGREIAKSALELEARNTSAAIRVAINPQR